MYMYMYIYFLFKCDLCSSRSCTCISLHYVYFADGVDVQPSSPHTDNGVSPEVGPY